MTKATYHRRAGSVLPLMAVLIFLLVTLTALVLDLGVAIFHRRQMQSLVNAAACDALRGHGPADGNPTNATTGDIVGGMYLGGANHREQANYERLDFARTGVDAEFDAVLARQRKTGEFDIHGGTAEARVASLLGPGIAVRATAIAQTQRVKVVGVADANRNLIGALPFALTRDYWDSIAVGNHSVAVALNQLKSIPPSETLVGITLSPSTHELKVTDPLVAGAWSGSPPSSGYVSVVVEFPPSTGQYRVIGFGYVDGITLANGTLAFSKRAKHIAVQNASAQFRGVAADLSGNANTLRSLLEHHDRYQHTPATLPFSDPLLAPALVQATD